MVIKQPESTICIYMHMFASRTSCWLYGWSGPLTNLRNNGTLLQQQWSPLLYESPSSRVPGISKYYSCRYRHVLGFASLERRFISCVVSISIWPANRHDVIKWKRFPHYWPFVRGIHPHKGQWRGVLMKDIVHIYSKYDNLLIISNQFGEPGWLILCVSQPVGQSANQSHGQSAM